MARIIICCLVICLAVVFCEASRTGPCPCLMPWQPRPALPRRHQTPRFSHTLPREDYLDCYRDYRCRLHPRFIHGGLVIDDIPERRRGRRDVDSQKDTIFKLIDMNGNKYIEICEWVEEGGSAINFVAFLSDDDTNGDEKISWQEFQAVNV